MMNVVEFPLGKGLVAIADAVDAGLLGQYSWHRTFSTRTWYAARVVIKPDGRPTKQSMHKMLTGYDKTDHINGNGLDNRRENLRPATTAQNMFNQRKKRNSSSPYKGVCWYKQLGRWSVQITASGRKVHLGYFDDEIAAAREYDTAARWAFGEFAALNFPRPGERCALDLPPVATP